MTRWLAFAREFISGIWFRAVVFTIGGVAVTVVAYVVGVVVPERVPADIGQGAVGPILEILAASMLAVTTFSLTAMVAAYSAAASSGTPRTTQLLMADPTSKNALSTFVGTFAFSIVGIIAISAEVYSTAGETVLFLATLVVVVVVLATLLRWIAFLIGFGQMDDIIDRVEDAAVSAMSAYARDPWLGAQDWVEPPAQAIAIPADVTGYVVHVDVSALQHVAHHHDVELWLLARPGSRASPHAPLALVSSPVPPDLVEHLQHAFVVEQHRTYSEDPRLGLIALSEIASRAVSPAVNDPGTAIGVLSAQQRVLSLVVGGQPTPATDHDHVHVRPISPSDFLVDAFRPIARDGAGTVEVAIRLQKEIGSLLPLANADWAVALRECAVAAYQRAEQALSFAPDRQDLAAVHQHVMAT